MEITEDSLFEVLEDKGPKDDPVLEVGKIYTVLELRAKIKEYIESHNEIAIPKIQESYQVYDWLVTTGAIQLTNLGEVEKKVKDACDFAIEIIEQCDFALGVDENEKLYLDDLQEGWLGGYDSYQNFDTLKDALDRLDTFTNDYVYISLEEREEEGEEIGEDDWDLRAKNFLDDGKNYELLNLDYATNYTKQIAELPVPRYNRELQKVAEHNKLNKLEWFENEGRWTPVDLVLRRYLNDGETSEVFLGLNEEEFQRALSYIRNNFEDLVNQKQISTYGKNNYGFELWKDFDGLAKNLNIKSKNKEQYSQPKHDAVENNKSVSESGRMEQEIKQEKHHSRNW